MQLASILDQHLDALLNKYDDQLLPSHLNAIDAVKSPPAKPVAYWVSPSKGQKKHEPPKAARSVEQFQLIITGIFGLLVTNIGSDNSFIQTDGRHKIASSPKIFTSKIPRFSSELAGNLNCAFSFQVSNNVRYHIFWRNP